MTKSAANYIRDNKHILIDSWEKAVNGEISASENTQSLVLRNLLPTLLHDVASIMGRFTDREDFLKNEKCEEIVEKSLDHGRHRAASSQYTVKQIIDEYIILNRILVETLIPQKLFNTDISIIITFCLETSMSHSISSFNDSLQEMREKLVGTLAHDVRNPISAAYFALDVMKLQREEEQFENTRKMAQESLRKSLDLLEGLLDAISVEAGEGIALNFRKSDIVEKVKAVQEEATEIYSNKIKIVCEAEKLITVFDPTAVGRVLENLLTNAVKYGGLDQAITIYVDYNEENVILKVHNHGNPISPKNQKIIFDFLNHSEEQPGKLKSWGMGLTFVKMAAKAHGGHVELSSDHENGTTFFVFLSRHSNKPGKVRSKLNYGE
ncbi:sensor histidine kinase [Autumnicola musiva]|uniref:histidine kinase n=1 Tax=Autumnicola musiva TaxID=3075589 RepID=A0ABU3D991_9FLAO|nr:HAMP domain-containing sensor histidine kinase [Zunongwangia sp. F117]MDT0678102.1 HAMP domain-containing sensor histidine kinase [Zunongwangia sp. F117]